MREGVVVDGEEKRDRFRGAVLGAVVGDVFGFPFEGHRGPVPLEAIAEIEDGGSPLGYTDDTAMTFGLAESLIECGGLDLDHLARTFAAHYADEPRRGYGRSTKGLLRAVSRGADWREATSARFHGEGSYGNGASMRVSPVALWADGDAALAAELARASAVVTHTHEVAIEGAAMQAVAVTTALAGDAPPDLAGFVPLLRAHARTAEAHRALDGLASLPLGATPAQVADTTGNWIRALDSVPAAIAAAATSPGSFVGTIRFAIGMGGDADTIASMAGAIAGARLGHGAIPEPWIRRSEGADRALELADALFEAVRPPGTRERGRGR